MDVSYAIFIGLMLLVGIIIVGSIVGSLYDRYLWNCAKEVHVQCTLLKASHSDSTLETHSVPTVTSNGDVGVGVVTTGDDESYTTIWDCGEYGRLVTDDEDVFRWAKKSSTLIILLRSDGQAQIGGIIR